MDARRREKWNKTCKNRDRSEVLRQICEWVDREFVPRSGTTAVESIPEKTCDSVLYGNRERFLSIDVILENYADYEEIVRQWDAMRGNFAGFLVFLGRDGNKYMKLLLMDPDVESYRAHLTERLVGVTVEQIRRALVDVRQYGQCLLDQEMAAATKKAEIAEAVASARRKTMKKKSPSPGRPPIKMSANNPFRRGRIGLSPRRTVKRFSASPIDRFRVAASARATPRSRSASRH